MENKRKNLLARRRRLIKEISKNWDMICGLYGIYRRCGKPGCKCQKIKGYRHEPVWCFHYKERGKIKAEYIPTKYADRVKKQAEQYKNYKTIGMKIGNINKELLKMEIKKD